MTIHEVVAELQKQKQDAVASRFPCRAIMVKNIEQYCELLSALKKISDIRVVESLELFSNDDIMPNYDNLKAEKYQHEWLILTGVSEYLRLFARKEATDRRFASLWSHKAAASSTGRIIIPLWGCEAQWFDKAINLAGDLRQEDFYVDCSDPHGVEPEMHLLILSGMFEQYIPKLETIHGDLKIGLREWFDYWTAPRPQSKEFVLLTKRCNGIATTNGAISIHVLKDALSFIRENMDGANILSENNCTAEMQDVLFDYALKGISLDSALLSILNMSTFSGIDVMGKWKALPDSHKNFAASWFKLHPDDTYISHCFRVAKNLSNIADTVMLEIFTVRLHKPEWVEEYRQLAAVMDGVPDAHFFEELDKIPVYETRLELLQGKSRDERIYLLRMVGKWMREDFAQVVSCARLKEIYPELYAYLNWNAESVDGELIGYMSRYQSHKLENSLPTDESLFFMGIQPELYDYRYAVLSTNTDADTAILWIDALGVEWLPLLVWTLSQKCDGTIWKTAVTQANLPTETCYNELWKAMDVPYEKLDKLDKLAHKGVIDEPDYYACIQEQIAFVAGVHTFVSALLKGHHRVIVVGDHGTSRLAARFFHTRDGMDVPKDANVCSHGRYCKLTQTLAYTIHNACIVKHPDGAQYAVYSNYDHFKQSGFAAGADDETVIYGEVHGGATPEEMLVPVIVIDSNKEIPLEANWEKSTVKIAKKEAKLVLCFNRPIQKLMVKASGIDGIVSPLGDGSKWTIVLPGIKQGTYTVQIFADRTLVTADDICVQPALGGGFDLP